MRCQRLIPTEGAPEDVAIAVIGRVMVLRNGTDQVGWADMCIIAPGGGPVPMFTTHTHTHTHAPCVNYE